MEIDKEKNSFFLFAGNKDVQEYLHKILKQEELSHAYIFSGPSHTGKKSFAFHMAKQCIAKSRKWDQDVKDERDILRHISSLIPLQKKKSKSLTESFRTIDIESIREYRRRLSYGSQQGITVCIIEEAHTMTISAQNAFLKILEEPKENIIFFLLTDRVGFLLPTLVSRCEKITFSLVAKEEMEEFFFSPGAEFDKDLIDLSFGRPGIFQELRNDTKKISDKRTLLHFFTTFPSRNVYERIIFAEKISSKPEKMLELFEMWIEYKRWKSFSQKESPVTLYREIELIDNASDRIRNTNASPRLIAESLFFSL
ncbi:MAG: AAA family ATPase [Candidatus Moranbacteria bacterium]|nr:AAA family ATPase [Candidatus Moranbacteria bacterium]